jgi:hypothetical protein
MADDGSTEALTVLEGGGVAESRWSGVGRLIQPNLVVKVAQELAQHLSPRRAPGAKA